MAAISGLATRPLYDSTDSLLRFAMRIDATLTGLAGLAVAAAADPISSLTGLTSAAEYGLGAACVLYGLVVFSLAALPNLRRAGIGVVVANIVCTLAAVAVVAADSLPLTAAGIAATLAGGVYTAFFAMLQYLGVRRLRA
jgi:GNAT superfamily N-acetyltransferase